MILRALSLNIPFFLFIKTSWSCLLSPWPQTNAFWWQQHPIWDGPSMQKPPCLGTPDLYPPQNINVK